MRKICRKLHLWLSLPFGLIITLICLTGAALVFEQEIMEATRPRLYFVGEAGPETLPVGRVAGIVAQSLPDSVRVTGVTISSDPLRTWQVSLSQPRRASVCVDPYTGQIAGRSERAPFFTCMFKLHRWLLDSAKPDGIFWGKLIVGISTLLFVFVLLSGVVVWVPRTYRVLKNRLSISVCKGWSRFWFDLHVSAGIYATVFLLIMALTGLTWSFPWYRSGFYKLFGVETAVTGHGKQEPSDKGHGRGSGERRVKGDAAGHEERRDDFRYWNDIYLKIKATSPDYTRIAISDGKATVAVKRWGNQRALDSYEFDQHTGTITETVVYESLERSSKLRGWIYSLHVGNWGGVVSKILTFLAALIGASLPLTGYYLWIKRLRHKNR